VTVRVEYLDPEPTGLTAMVGGIIEGNLRDHPDRARLLVTNTVVGIRVPDVGAEVSLRLQPDRVQVRSGLTGRPEVLVQADSDTLLGLSSVPLRFGLPDVGTKEGRAVLGKFLRRDLRIRGVLRHPRKLARLNKLLSVG